ncbi:MAG TPA: response regulator transcription factor [Ideonella sp.]|uniref:response regulator transcription factor n=1 Tax=Ideonella sp. TaxID=1929293 RepID=UPI002C2FE17E|nr:response regulator transcription factor [Ideonella sp.]HSI46702.1 response regulator transcription factor [Ideonella sp.]
MPTDSPERQIKLMIVDDHAVVRDGLKAVFAMADDLTVVAEAGNSTEALARLRDCPPDGAPDVVLMDVGMKGGESGIDLTARLLDEDPERVVLMLSMHDGTEIAQRALRAGARGYVLKDSPSSEILHAIRTVFAGGTFLSPAMAARLFRGPSSRPLLSDREQHVLSFLGQGLASKQIANTLNLSVRTVESHRQNIRRKLNLAGQAELIKYAVENAARTGG